MNVLTTLAAPIRRLLSRVRPRPAFEIDDLGLTTAEIEADLSFGRD